MNDFPGFSIYFSYGRDEIYRAGREMYGAGEMYAAAVQTKSGVWG
jgi:hypothetical protein